MISKPWFKRIVIVLLLIMVSMGILVISSTSTSTVQAEVEEITEVFLTDEASSLLTARNRVFWNTDCGGEFNPARSRVRSSFYYEAWETSHYYPSTCQTDRVASINVAVEGDYIYWLTGDGRVVRKSIYGGSIVTLANTVVSTVPSHSFHIDASDSYVYWNESTALYRVPLSGGTRQTVFTSITSGIRDIKVTDSERVFFLAGNENLVHASALFFGGSYIWSSSVVQSQVEAFTIDDGRVYYAYDNNTGSTTNNFPLVSKSFTNLAGSESLTPLLMARAIPRLASWFKMILIYIGMKPAHPLDLLCGLTSPPAARLPFRAASIKYCATKWTAVVNICIGSVLAAPLTASAPMPRPLHLI